MNAQGADVIHFDPVEVKQGFIAPTELRRKEVPRILHPKPTQLYEVYLREHRVVLLNHLGRNRQHEPANLPAGVFTLFPGFGPKVVISPLITALFILRLAVVSGRSGV